jgi:hypothetical protein
MNYYCQLLQRIIRSWLRARVSYNALSQQRLLAGRFRNRLILHAFDKMPRAAGKSTLLKGGLPAGIGRWITPRPAPPATPAYPDFI